MNGKKRSGLPLWREKQKWLRTKQQPKDGQCESEAREREDEGVAQSVWTVEFGLDEKEEIRSSCLCCPHASPLTPWKCRIEAPRKKGGKASLVTV